MPKKQLNQKVLIEAITLNAGTQQRQLSPDVVSHYADLRSDGIELPPVEIIRTGKDDILWDGFHRIAVAKNLGENHIRANIQIGTERQAIWLSYKANSEHGFTRQPGATKFILEAIFADPEWSQMTVQEIARHVGCSRKHASQVKNEGGAQPGGALLDKKQEPKNHPTGRASPNAAAGPRTETEQNSPLQDDEGQDIPPHLADMFLSRSVIKERINEIDKVKNSIENSIAGGNMTYALINGTTWLHAFNTFRFILKSAIPHAICPYCKGKCCGACHNSGFLNKATWEAAPKNQGE